MSVDEQRLIDEAMIELDGTPNKSKLGANAMLSASLACLHAGAASHEVPLWKYIGGGAEGQMPVPMLNILNGGAHAASNVDVREFMVMPHGFSSFAEGLRAGVEIYHQLKSELKTDGLLGGVGDEGFCSKPRSKRGRPQVHGTQSKERVTQPMMWASHSMLQLLNLKNQTVITWMGKS